MRNLIQNIFSPLKNIENENIEFDIGFWKSIGVILLWLTVDAIVMVLIYALCFQSKSEATIISIFAIVRLFTLPIEILILNKVFGRRTNKLNTFKKVNKKTLFHITLLLLVFRLLFDAFILPMMLRIPENDTLIQAEQALNSSLIYAVLSVCIIAPIIEEVIFRGIILNGMLKRYNPSTAIIISSLFFAFAHGNFHQGVNAFLLALIIGCIYYKTHSLYLAIYCHFFNNITPLFFLIPLTVGGIAFNIVISCLISIPVLIYLKKHMHLNYERRFIRIIPIDENLYSNDET